MIRQQIDSRKYLNPEIVSRLSNMELRARLVVEGFITGLHKSPYHGFSVEFAEHRPYMPGDEIRRIDWKVFGKRDRFYVKQYEEETNLKAYIILDASGSMGYSSAALSYLMLNQRDAVGLTTFDTKIRRHLPPRSIKGYLHVILSELENTETGEATDVSVILHELAERIKRRGLIILISDLLDDKEKVVSGLKHFRHRKHEVLVFHILDRYEVDFSFSSDAVFRDIETSEELNTQTWHIQREYKRQMKLFLDHYKRECHNNLIDYVFMDTSRSLDEALVQFLIKRKRLV